VAGDEGLDPGGPKLRGRPHHLGKLVPLEEGHVEDHLHPHLPLGPPLLQDAVADRGAQVHHLGQGLAAFVKDGEAVPHPGPQHLHQVAALLQGKDAGEAGAIGAVGAHPHLL
jgi:hypothetical protein